MSTIDLVFTAALSQELPATWLRDQGVAVHRLAALKSGALKAQSGPNTGILIVLTGVGPEAAREAACWIRDHLTPRFVVNLGTAGALHRNIGTGVWITPRSVDNEAGDSIPVDTRLPFPWPCRLTRNVEGKLLSVRDPRPGRPHPEWLSRDYVDMECHAQAAVFADTGIAFHTLKWVSDVPGVAAEEMFAATLPDLRLAVQEIFGFVVQREPARISVVIPVHNRVERIAATLQSVLDQSLPASELIVVDDASDDGTRELLTRYADAITVVQLPANRGVSAARNAGVSAASTDWIAFLDSDDHWTLDNLAEQWDFHKQHPHYVALQCEEIWIRNGIRVNPHNHHAKPAGWIWSPSLQRCLVSPSGILLRKALFEKLGGFDESLPACEDYDLWIRLSRYHVVGLAPHAGVIKHGGHDDQLSRRYSAMDRFRVTALLKALHGETENSYREQLVAVLRGKLKILIQGARKRALVEETRYYENLLSALHDDDQLLSTGE